MTRHQVERGNEPPAASSVRTAATYANTAFAAVWAGAPAPASGLLLSNAQAPFRAGHGAMDFGAGPDQYLRGNRSS